MKKILTISLATVLAVSLAIPALHAAEIAGVTLEESLQIGEKKAALTGMGLRTKTFLKVKVYVAGLYMEDPSLKAGDIIASDQSKAIVMNFLYKEVEGEKLQESWRDGFDSNTPSAGADLKKQMDRFVSLFTDSAMKGDRYVFAYEPGKGTSISLKGEVKAMIPGRDFASALMAIWFGDKLGDGGLKNLKKSMLQGM